METMLTSQGELRRRFGALSSNTNEIPKCIQTYFFSSEDATKYRMINMKNQPKSDTEKATYEKMFKMIC